MAIKSELLEQLIAIRREHNEFMKLADIAIVDAGEGTARLEFTAAPKHINPQGVVQGGVMMTAVDAAMATALAYLNDKIATIDMNYHFLGAVHEGEHVVCEARVIKPGRRIIVTEGTLKVGEKLVGNATASFMTSGVPMIEEDA
ncbi:MAG: PaaI family thioesterase [Peptoniphilaceae bacterium]|nr:PaaI family thioesterase [Peptoniphilaceae bacterium]MDY6085171.1 PaaI family thioesterase [Peptoniphilaceae bacterium]